MSLPRPALLLALLLLASPGAAQEPRRETLPILPGPEARETREPGAGTPLELLVQGNAYYEQGRYEDAARAYQTALAYGVKNEILHYNLGNALFRLGRLGPAILEYERALLLAPGDEDIRANLGFARSHAPDVPPPAEEGPIAIVRSWLQRPGINGSSAAALGAYLVGATLLGVALARRGVRGNLLGMLASAAFLLAIPPTLVIATQGLAREADRRAVVMADRAECRSGPGETNPVLFTVHEGTTVQVLDQRGDWSRVGLPDGLNGWLREDAIERVKESLDLRNPGR